MCLALPARIVKLQPPDNAVVEMGGIERVVSIALLDTVAVDDYVIVHVGYALSKLDEAEAQMTLQAFAEMARAGESKA